MNLKYLFIFLLGFSNTILYASDNEVIFNNKSYKLTFFDDFEGYEIDSEKWGRCKEGKRQNYNGYWKNDCSYVKDGNLVIECRSNENGTFYSGAISTKDKFVQNQGLFEIKFKITKSSGLWYAFWLNRDGMFNEHKKKKTAEEGLEIDIFEILPSKNVLNTAVHYGGYEYFNNILLTKSRQYMLDDFFYDDYHIVKFVWNDEGYELWLDKDKLYHLASNSAGGICNEAAYVLLSSEFGSWGGEIVDELLPAYMYVDYVKVYEKL